MNDLQTQATIISPSETSPAETVLLEARNDEMTAIQKTEMDEAEIEPLNWDTSEF